MRPWTQSYIYYSLVKVAQFFDINNPFTWSLIIKTLSSLLGFISIIYLLSNFKKIFIKEENHFNYFIFFCFWFYPFLHSRTSSENVGISIFIISICFLYNVFVNKKEVNKLLLFLFGLILGASLVIKFNLIISLFPILVWVLIFRMEIIKILIVTLGTSISLLIGIIIDSLSYGDFNITYWNFFYWNIVWGRMAEFGHQPIYFYFTSILLDLAPFVSLFFIISIFYYAYKNPKSIFTFFIFFPIVILSFLSHKELRYVFQIYYFCPLFIIYFFYHFRNFKFIKYAKILVIVSNLIFLSITTFAAANGKVALYKFIYNQNIKDDTLFYLDENPYLINEMEPFFYTHSLPLIKEATENNFFNKGWLLTNNFKNYKSLTSKNNCIKKYSSFPESIINLNKNWKKKNFNWFVIYCS